MSLQLTPSPMIPTANLILSTSALLTTILTLFPLPFNKPFKTVLRALHTAVLLSPIILSILTLHTLITSPTSTIAPPSQNINIFRVLQSTADIYNASIGLTIHIHTPSRGDGHISLYLHIFIVSISLVSAFIMLISRSSIPRYTAFIAFFSPALYVLITLLTAFKPGSLPLDSSLLENSWLDAAYQNMRLVNETRMLENFWLADHPQQPLQVVWVPTVPSFRDNFCDTFNRIPIEQGLVVDTESDDDITFVSTRPPSNQRDLDQNNDEQEELYLNQKPKATQEKQLVVTRNLLSHLLIVYTIGKPFYTTFAKSISLLSLPFLSLTPIFISRAVTSPVLFPFVIAWIGALLTLIIYATPETLRPITAPFESSQLLSFCGRQYRVFVTDSGTNRIVIFDVVSFAVVGVTSILQGFRWLRRDSPDDEPVKMVTYDQVFSKSGSLRW